ncbi:hypothetical protein C8R43DRAFT_1129483 [Mycena crocata]|nr:hypothetical protein C8R43DRAFT_1129483 [Mycena crocata]
MPLRGAQVYLAWQLLTEWLATSTPTSVKNQPGIRTHTQGAHARPVWRIIFLRRQLLALARLASQDDAAATRAYLPASRCFSYENDGFSNEAFALCAILKHIGCLPSAFTPTSGRAIALALPVACLLPASNFRAPIDVHNQNTVGASTSCYHTFVRCFRTLWRTQGTSRV